MYFNYFYIINKLLIDILFFSFKQVFLIIFGFNYILVF